MHSIARQVFLEAGADDVLLNIEQLPAWIQANRLKIIKYKT